MQLEPSAAYFPLPVPYVLAVCAFIKASSSLSFFHLTVITREVVVLEYLRGIHVIEATSGEIF